MQDTENTAKTVADGQNVSKAENYLYSARSFHIPGQWIVFLYCNRGGMGYGEIGYYGRVIRASDAQAQATQDQWEAMRRAERGF